MKIYKLSYDVRSSGDTIITLCIAVRENTLKKAKSRAREIITYYADIHYPGAYVRLNHIYRNEIGPIPAFDTVFTDTI